MTDQQLPPDWVLIEAAKRGDWCVDASIVQKRDMYDKEPLYHALCDALWKLHEAGLLPAPVDRKLLCVEQAMYEHGWDNAWIGRVTCCRAIELWEEGFGND